MSIWSSRVLRRTLLLSICKTMRSSKRLSGKHKFMSSCSTMSLSGEHKFMAMCTNNSSIGRHKFMSVSSTNSPATGQKFTVQY